MKQRAKKLMKNPLIYGSSILVMGSLFANFFNFLFNLFMTRNLSNADYGVLASAISLISMPALMTGAIIPMVVQFAGNYFAQKQLDLARGFYYQMLRYFLFFGVMLLVLMLIGTPRLGEFLHISDTSVLIMTSIIVFFGVLHTINMAFLQAKLAFGSTVGINVSGASTKLLFGVLAVLAGYEVSGAVGAILVSTILAYIFSFWPIRFVFNKTQQASPLHPKKLFKYGLSSTLTVIGITSFITADILMVKHFFSPDDAGMYAALALIGKVIFYLVAPIESVMFSLVVQKYSNKENIVPTFLQALFLVLLPASIIACGYYVFPEQTILFFTKKTENLIASPLVGLMGLSQVSYSVLFMVANFYLSINKTKIAFPMLLGAIAQIVGIYLFHDNFSQVILCSLVVTVALNIFLLGYFFRIIQRR